jgi:hypothetical protein
MTMTKNFRRPVAVATLALVLGVSASLAMNYTAVQLTGTDKTGAYISALIWPVFLFVAIELLIHTPWLANWRDHLTKLGVIVLVGGLSAYVSYFHGAHVLSSYGYDVVSRYMGPLAIDAMMAMATMSLNRIGHARRMAKAELATAPVSTPEPVRTVDTATEDALATAGAELASETEGYLARLATQLDSTTTPAVPVISGHTEPLPRRRPASEGQGVTDEARALIRAWALSPDRPAKGQADEALAAYFNVTTRTARRWRGLTLGSNADAGQQDS